MPSFQLTITPSRREATRFINNVRRSIQKALIEERRKSGLTQSEIARRIGVHRSVINREIRGQKDLTLGRVAELAYALGREPTFEMRVPQATDGANAPLTNLSATHSLMTSEVNSTAFEVDITLQPLRRAM